MRTRIYLGNGYRRTKYRLYKLKRINGKIVDELVSWTDKRCRVCGKFLPKMNNSDRCRDCYDKYWNKLDNRKDKKERLLYYKAYRYLQNRGLLGIYFGK